MIDWYFTTSTTVILVLLSSEICFLNDLDFALAFERLIALAVKTLTSLRFWQHRARFSLRLELQARTEFAICTKKSFTGRLPVCLITISSIISLSLLRVLDVHTHWLDQLIICMCCRSEEITPMPNSINKTIMKASMQQMGELLRPATAITGTMISNNSQRQQSSTSRCCILDLRSPVLSPCLDSNRLRVSMIPITTFQISPAGIQCRAVSQ